MDEQNKRIDISDLPRAEEELTNEEAKNVQGGITKVGPGTLQYQKVAPANTPAGSVADNPVDPSRNMGDGSV